MTPFSSEMQPSGTSTEYPRGRTARVEELRGAGAMVYLTDCVELMRLMPAAYVDVVFADPPYLLSGGGVTVKSGRVTSVDWGVGPLSGELRKGPRMERTLAAGGLTRTQAQRHALGQQHAPRHLQPRLRVADTRFQNHQRHPLGVQTPGRWGSGSECRRTVSGRTTFSPRG
jgi:hypothetical protein